MVRAVVALVAIAACSGDGGGPHTLFARYVKAGGTCTGGNLNTANNDATYFTLEPAPLAIGSGTFLAIASCASPTECAADTQIHLQLTSPTTASKMILSGDCGYDGECGCIRGMLTRIEDSAELTDDRISLSLLNMSLDVGPDGSGCTSDAVLAQKDDPRFAPCTLEGQIAADAPSITEVVPVPDPSGACTTKYTLRGHHFARDVVVGVQGGCLGPGFGVGDGLGEYCPVPIDAVSSTAITFHFNSCTSGYIVVMNPDPGVSLATLQYPGQRAYAMIAAQ